MSIDPDSPWHDPNPPVSGRRNTRTILAVSGVALVVVVVGALVGTVLRDKSLSQFDDTLVFQPRDVTTADPFTPDLAGINTPFSDQATEALNADRESMTYDTVRGTRTVTGTTPGLYGGTGNNTACNVEAAAQFLAQNPNKGAAWGSVFGITTDQIPYYLNTLTPVVLASDTWVTDHTYRNGRAVPFQSVLQAGTAVMVDPAGVPRVHCSCGNPMSPPADRPITDYSTDGTRWADYEPENVVAVKYADATPVAQAESTPAASVPSPTVNDFQLLDLITAEPLLRTVRPLVDISAAAPLSAPLPDPVTMNVATKAESRVPIAAAAGELEPEVDEPSTSERSTTSTGTTTTTTTAAATTTTTTAQQPVAPIAEPTTTTVVSPAPQPPAVTTRTTPPPAPAQPRVVDPSTTTPPVTTTTTTTLAPTTTPAVPPTRFSGPASGTVTSLALADGTSCRAIPPAEEPVVPTPRNGSGATESAAPTTTQTTTRQAPSSIEFTCTDGSTLGFRASELSSAAIDDASVDGVWKVRTDAGSVAVTSAVRSVG